jgi:predicted nucleotidyltransferase component of viral defense system
MQARDFYDIWNLMEKHGLNIEFYMNEFKNKCTVKGLKSSMFPTKLSERIPQYKGRWQVSMNDQIKDLPGFEQVEREVQRNLKKLKF